MSQPILESRPADLERGFCDDRYLALARFMAQDPDNETLVF
jgi:hypothetical protein